MTVTKTSGYGNNGWKAPGSWSINYANKLVRRPIFVAAFNEDGGIPRTEGFGYNGPLTRVGTAGWAISPGNGLRGASITGVCGDFPASGDDWRVPALTADIIPTGQVTLAMVRQKPSTAITNAPSFGVLLSGGSLDAVHRAGGHLPFLDGTVYWDFGGFSGANRLTWGGYTPGTGTEIWVFVAGSLGSAIYFNGLLVASQGTGISRTQTPDPVCFNTGNAVTTSNPNRALLWAAFDAQWTPSDVMSFAINPQQIISAPSVPIFARTTGSVPPPSGAVLRTLMGLGQ